MHHVVYICPQTYVTIYIWLTRNEKKPKHRKHCTKRSWYGRAQVPSSDWRHIKPNYATNGFFFIGGNLLSQFNHRTNSFVQCLSALVDVAKTIELLVSPFLYCVRLWLLQIIILCRLRLCLLSPMNKGSRSKTIEIAVLHPPTSFLVKGKVKVPPGAFRRSRSLR